MTEVPTFDVFSPIYPPSVDHQGIYVGFNLNEIKYITDMLGWKEGS